MAVATIGAIRSARIGPWRGMNEKISPDLLPASLAADLQNVLLDEIPGTVIKRFGTLAQAALPSGLPPRDTHVFTKLDGTEIQLVSDGVTLYSCTDPSSATFYTALTTGLNPDGLMAFETAENKVWMSNGIDPVMSWDGTTLIKFDRTFTSVTNLTTVDTTHLIHAGLTSSDDYWNGMKLVFTVGANVGTVVTVTDYVEATKTITFTPAVAGIAATDRFIIGLIIPKGAALRYWDGHLFDGCTTDNAAELRFSEISDPDTGEVMSLDNPRAWPASNELALTVLDQERLWGLSPILRDRVLVHKATGIWRLERDPLVRYRLEAVSRAVGSRFPDTWAEKNNLLYFLGQDKDGFPEVYKTDMVDVSPVDPDGGIEPTLRGLQQPNSVQNSQTFSSTADFDAGTKSTLANTADGQLAAGAFDAANDWQGSALISGANVDVETTPGSVAILGCPVWEVRYEADALPSASTPVWEVGSASNGAFPNQVSQAISPAGTLHISNGPTFAGGIFFQRRNVLDQTKDAFMSIRCKGKFAFGLWNGSRGVEYFVEGPISGATTLYRIGGAGIRTTVATLSTGTTYTFSLLLGADNTVKLWIDGAIADSHTSVFATTFNAVLFAMGQPVNVDPPSYNSVTVGFTADFEFVYYHSDFKGNKLSSFSNRIFPVVMPDTLPTTGVLIMQNDATRAPDALRRLWQVSVLNGGTVGLESWTAGSVDFLSAFDPAGYLATANGAVPASVVHQYQRLRTTLTRADYANGPELQSLASGMLWLSPAVQIGSAIGAWRTFLANLTKPVGSDQTIKIRMATVNAIPIELDWGAWFTITNGDNIGTILGDSPTPSARWVQLKVEEGVDSTGDIPFIEAMVVQWSNGTSTNSPIRAIVHKKRYMITAATTLVSENNIILVCDRNDQWTKFRGLSLNAMVHYKGNLYGLDAAAATQRRMDVDGSFADDGNAIDAFLVTREESFDAQHLRKNYRFSYIHWDRVSTAYTLTTSYRRTGDSAFTGSGTLSMGIAGLDVRQNFPIATVGKRIQRKYENNVLGESMSLMGEMFYFDIRPVQP